MWLICFVSTIPGMQECGIDGWMDRWMDEWVSGWMDRGWVDG